MYVIIAGGGKVGRYLARDLSAKGYTIALIERRRERSQDIAMELPNIMVIHGDACDANFLEDAGIDRADVVVAVTGDDDDNLVVSQLATEVYGIKRVIARVNNPKNEKIFRVLNVGIPISATSIIGRIVEEEATIEDIVTILPLKEGKLSIVEARVPEGSSVDGRKISEIGFPKDCILIALARDDDLIIPRGSTTLKRGDIVFAMTKIDKEKIFCDCLRGKRLC